MPAAAREQREGALVGTSRPRPNLSFVKTSRAGGCVSCRCSRRAVRRGRVASDNGNRSGFPEGCGNLRTFKLILTATTQPRSRALLDSVVVCSWPTKPRASERRSPRTVTSCATSRRPRLRGRHQYRRSRTFKRRSLRKSCWMPRRPPRTRSWSGYARARRSSATCPPTCRTRCGSPSSSSARCQACCQCSARCARSFAAMSTARACSSRRTRRSRSGVRGAKSSSASSRRPTRPRRSARWRSRPPRGSVARTFCRRSRSTRTSLRASTATPGAARCAWARRSCCTLRWSGARVSATMRRPRGRD